MEENQCEDKAQATKPADILTESNGKSTATGDHQDGVEPKGKKVDWGGESTRDHDGDDKPNAEAEQTGQAVETAEKKKKKKKRKSNKSKGANKPSGFEEYYVDAPITPDEYKEELDLYDSSKTFRERIQIAIQRYFSRRKFDSVRKDLFDKYMSFGGIASGPNMFGNSDVKNEDLTAGDIADMKATHYVSEEADKDFVVDFDGMLKAFLSSRMPAIFDLSQESNIKNHVQVIRNFLNYLLHHDVCPEYRDQIEAARRTCDTGAAQLWLIQQSLVALPGDFNKACSTIFGGYYQSDPVADRGWAEKMGLSKGFDHEKASHILQGGLAAYGDEAMCDLYNRQVASNKARHVNSFKTTIEVTALEFASAEVEDLYHHPSMSGCIPLGKLGAQTWHCEGDSLEDLTEEEEARRARNEDPTHKYEFWVENVVLEKMFVGMKLEVIVHELSFGVRYFDTVSAALCSFYCEVPNELMIGWKPHKYLEPRATMEPDTVEAYVPSYVPLAGNMPDAEKMEKIVVGEDIMVNV